MIFYCNHCDEPMMVVQPVCPAEDGASQYPVSIDMLGSEPEDDMNFCLTRGEAVRLAVELIKGALFWNRRC